MPWIDVIDEQEATGDLAEVYAALAGKRGKVANIMKVHSLNPRAMQTHMELYMAIMFGSSGLKRETRELIAVVISSANGCDYCVNHHAEALNHYWKDEARLARLVKDYETAELPKEQLAVLGYALKLTRAPHDMTEADLEPLHEAGFSDRDVLEINLIVSYFNFVNRIALGLGVGFTADEVAGYRY